LGSASSSARHAGSVIDQREMDRLARRDAARLPPASMLAGLVFSLMAIPVTLSLLNAISPIIGYGVIVILGGWTASA
jgi:membrane glycosyltransferase